MKSLPIALLTVLDLALPAQAQHHHEPAAQHSQDQRVGDPYPLDTCPVSGKKLGAMGAPVVKVYDGREVRFCCGMCPEKFEKSKAAGMAAIDEKIVKDQAALYPLKTSVVTGKELPASPYALVYGNRLVRLGSEDEKAEFLKDPTKSIGALDKAVIEKQGEHYPFKKCPVSGEQFGGEMGPPKDVVIAGRLIRLCCPSCKKDVEKDPAKFIAQADAAMAKKPHDHKDGHH